MKKIRDYEAGRPKIKLYLYSKEGKYLKKYASISELNDEYFEGRKVPLFTNKRWENFRYGVLKDGNFYSDFKIGRDKLLKCEKIFNSEYCFNKVLKKLNKKIGMYNLLDEKIAEFANGAIASVITGDKSNTIYYDCRFGKQKTNNYYYKFI